MTTHLSRFFRQRRRTHKISLVDLARQCGYTNVGRGAGRINRFEEYGWVHPDLLKKLAAALGVSKRQIRRFKKTDQAEWEARLPQPPRSPSITQIVEVWRLRRLERRLADDPGKEDAYLNRALALRAEKTDLRLRIAIAKRLLKEPPFDLARQEREREAVAKRLEAAKDVLWNDLRKMPRWEWLCRKKKATTVATQLRVAERVLAEPPTMRLSQWYSAWCKLYGIRSRRLKRCLRKLNMAKLRHFLRLCRERKATTAEEQIRIAEEVLAWPSALDSIGAGMAALAQLKGAKPMSLDEVLGQVQVRGSIEQRVSSSR